LRSIEFLKLLDAAYPASTAIELILDNHSANLQGRLNLDDLVSKRIALRDVNGGYAALKSGSQNRVVVTSF
jgi:Zn-dependent alcohol dehydrogenase